MSDLLAQKAHLEARYAELNQRLQAIRQDYANGFEADSEAAIARIQMEFKAALLAAKPDAKLPF